MKIGDEVYVHGYVDEIRGNTIIIKNKGGSFGTNKKEVHLERDWTARVYPTDKYAVLVIDDKIHIVNRKEYAFTVKGGPVTDCSWK